MHSRLPDLSDCWRIDRDERGTVNVGRVLIVVTIVILTLFTPFALKFGWPRVRDYFMPPLLQDFENEDV
jgi:hypothetical protein